MKRVWIIAGMVLITPCLLFTFLLGFAVLYCYILGGPHEWRVENRTAGPLWVTPLKGDDKRPIVIPYYAAPQLAHSARAFGEVQIEPGERTSLAIDSYIEMDIGGFPGLVVRTAAGEYWYCKGAFDGQSVLFVLDNRSLSSRASDEMIAAVRPTPTRGVMFGIPFGVTLVLGLAAPITLLWLRRSYRKLKPTS